MTACLNWTPEREQIVMRLAREIAEHVRDHRKRTGLSQVRYGRRFGLRQARVTEIECARKPNFTILTAVKLLELAGYTLRIVPKETERAITPQTPGSY